MASANYLSHVCLFRTATEKLERTCYKQTSDLSQFFETYYLSIIYIFTVRFICLTYSGCGANVQVAYLFYNSTTTLKRIYREEFHLIVGIKYADFTISKNVSTDNSLLLNFKIILII